MRRIDINLDRRVLALSAVLVICIAFSVVYVTYAAAPNPGHNFTEVGGGAVQGDILYASAADTLAALPKNATASRYISNGGTSNNPTWAQIDLTNGVTGALPLINGGTGAALTASNGGIVWSNASTLAVLAGTATAGQVLRSGASGAPTWSTATYPATAGAYGSILASDGTNLVSTSTIPGTLLAVRVLTTGTTYVPTAGTNSILVRLIGGGGGGAGATAAASAAAAGGGGGSGSYAEKRFTGISSTVTYTIAIGAAGAAGAAANGTGGTGGNTTFACAASCVGGAVTVTANGGLGGVGMTSGTTIISSLGGNGGAVSTNGDLNITGAPGDFSVRFSGTAAASGRGAPSVLGGGGNAKNTASAGSNGGVYGAGGGGALSLSATGVAGGTGAAGVIVIWEFE